ncbi:MAG: hypothetical protein KH423_06190 [Actinomycetaceae bacterium]|nr:hypothetical protein [Actinomycetaceae bacterium]
MKGFVVPAMPELYLLALNSAPTSDKFQYIAAIVSFTWANKIGVEGITEKILVTASLSVIKTLFFKIAERPQMMKITTKRGKFWQ